MTLYIILGVAAVLLAAAIRIRIWHKFWTNEGKKLQQSGYLPPAPSWFAHLFFLAINRLLVFMAIGPVKVIGRENLRKFRGRILVTPNHTQATDWALVNKGVDYERYTAVTSELRGVRGLLSGWSGCFGVDPKQPGGAQAFLNSCVQILAGKQNASLLYFPQGKLVADNVLRDEDFRPGAVRVLRATADQVGADNVAFLPVAIFYNEDRSKKTIIHRLMLCIGQKWFRNMFGHKNVGGVVVIGKPVLVSEMPVDEDPEHPHKATAFMQSKIQELLDVARKG